MSVITRAYYRLHRWASKPSERGEYSGGLWQDRIRAAALAFCSGCRGKVLEIGCGEGLFLTQLKLREPGVEAWGVDFDQGRLDRAAEKAAALGQKIHLSRENAVSLPFADGYFDAVVCVNVFFNLDSLATVAKVLAQMKRVCKGNGAIIFDYRNSRNLLLRIKYGLAPYYDATICDIPLRTYNSRQIAELLANEGLTVTRSRPIGSFWKRYAPIIIVEARR